MFTLSLEACTISSICQAPPVLTASAYSFTGSPSDDDLLCSALRSRRDWEDGEDMAIVLQLLWDPQHQF